MLADFSKRYTLKSLEQARVASTFDNLELDPVDRRALDIIKNGFVMPPPLNEELAGELSGIMTELEAMYGSGTHCFSENDCYDRNNRFQKNNVCLIHTLLQVRS